MRWGGQTGIWCRRNDRRFSVHRKIWQSATRMCTRCSTSFSPTTPAFRTIFRLASRYFGRFRRRSLADTGTPHALWRRASTLNDVRNLHVGIHVGFIVHPCDLEAEEAQEFRLVAAKVGEF